jgi:hypothetical protein
VLHAKFDILWASGSSAFAPRYSIRQHTSAYA